MDILILWGCLSHYDQTGTDTVQKYKEFFFQWEKGISKDYIVTC